MRGSLTTSIVVGLLFLSTGCGKKNTSASSPPPDKVPDASREPKKETGSRTVPTGKGQSLPPQPEQPSGPNPEAKIQSEIKKLVDPFLASLRAKDVDAVVKQVSLPFVIGYELTPKTVTTADELKAELKKRLGAVKDWGEFPTNADAAYTFENRQIDTTNVNQKPFEPIIAVAGRQGYLVDLMTKKPEGNYYSPVRVFVKYVEGKPQIVGFTQPTKE